MSFVWAVASQVSRSNRPRSGISFTTPRAATCEMKGPPHLCLLLRTRTVGTTLQIWEVRRGSVLGYLTEGDYTGEQAFFESDSSKVVRYPSNITAMEDTVRILTLLDPPSCVPSLCRSTHSACSLRVAGAAVPDKGLACGGEGGVSRGPSLNSKRSPQPRKGTAPTASVQRRCPRR
jgi:hypothetical protein